jgi:hypothetical protein
VSGVCAAFLVLVCVPALAGSHNSFSNENFANVALVGVSDTKVSGSFSFNSKTDKFSNCAISFSGNSIFNGINATDLKSVKGKYEEGQGSWLFTWQTHVGRDVIWYSILFNPNNGQFSVSGWIKNGEYRGEWSSVPEGGAMLAYLLLTGMAVFAGILLSGKQRRVTR